MSSPDVAGDFVLVVLKNAGTCPACGAEVEALWKHVPTERWIACEDCANR